MASLLIIALLSSSTVSFIRGQEAKHSDVQPYLVLGDKRSLWTLDTHRELLIRTTSARRKRSPDDAIRIVLDGKFDQLSLSLHPRGRHPVTDDTIIEWIDEDGQRTMWRAQDMTHCWYSGHVEQQNDSAVRLGICDGLSGYIRFANETLLLEPDASDPRHLNHVLYSPLTAGTGIDLAHDQHFGDLRMSTARSKRSSRSLQVDYDEEGNEITNTIQLEDLPDYHQSEDDEDDDEDNFIDDDDSVVQIRDYDVHPPVDVVTEEIVAMENETSPLSPSSPSEDAESDEAQQEFDGFNVDKLWEVPDDQLPQSGKRKKPVSVIKGVARVDPPKWLEMALAVDHTVIKFHGKQRVQQYVLTLLNIVSAIYEDTSLEASLQLVVSRLVFYEDRKQGQVREGNSKRSLENVNAWNAALLRNGAAERPHDIAVWLTRYELGGPSGYAPVAGVCDPDRSCSLNRDEGLTSAFIIAHEVGHVLGFSHDGDMAAGNDCSDEALQGSVMAPMVAATFSRFHWSRCTHWEYHFKQHNWKCLRNQPVNDNNITVIQSSIQYSYSLDEQCRMEFGEGYFLCRSFSLSDPCTHLWCGHRSSPQLCKTKKGPPLEGTPCAQDKWCIKGFCESIGKRKKNVGPVVKNPRDGSWGEWGPWNACSRTCGAGVRFRTRFCDSPPPANGGRPCEGPGEEFELCGIQQCSQLNDFRAEQCPLISQLNSLNATAQSLTWLPWEMNNQSSQCRLTCVAKETGEIFHSKENVIDGTLCSYEDPHGICVQGRCQTVGCDKRIGSTARENECGICNGKPGDCSVASRYYSGSPRPPYRRVVIIPRGARNIRVREETNTTNRLALRTRVTKEWVLNGTFPLNRQTSNGLTTVHFIWSATRFTYVSDHGQETIRARGPLLADLTLMIVPGVGRQQANVTVTWSRVSKSHRKKNPATSGHEVGRYVWEMVGWSPCSRTCGEGSQTQIWYCRDRKTDHVVRRKHCLATQDEPVITTRLCNTFRCDFRWVTGEWEGCSRTCGGEGTQMRLVYCVRTNMVNATAGSFDWGNGNKFAYSVDLNSQHEARRTPEVVDDETFAGDSAVLEETVANPKVDTWKPTIKDFKRKVALENQVLVWHPNAIADPALCRDQRPEEIQPCNRQPCPGVWVEKFWTKCSVTCGVGQQNMHFACLTKSKAKERGYTAAAFTALAVPYEDEDVDEDEDDDDDEETSVGQSAAGYKKRNGTNALTKPFCGARPTLIRPCKAADCPPEADFASCERQPAYCLLPFFDRYCVVPRFRRECCLTCAPSNDLPN